MRSSRIDGRGYDLVIIAPEKFSSVLKPLIDHKNSRGVNTTLMTTEDIYQNFTGRDKPEQIKFFIKYAIEHWSIRYVLLVGGLKYVRNATSRDNANEGSRDWYVPVRYTNLYIPIDDHTYEPGCISDLYYADIYNSSGNFSSWDSNGDGIYAAWDMPGVPNDKLDLYPDVAVGRLPCRNTFEVTIMVKKIITYENAVDKKWFPTMVAVAGYDITGLPNDENICDRALASMPDFTPVRVYASNNGTDGLTPTTKNIIKTIDKGCGFLLFEGAGNPSAWATRLDPNGWGSGGIKVYHLPWLLNGKKLPVCIIGGASHISLFNVTLMNTLFGDVFPSYWVYSQPTPECFSWWMTRKAGGGSIATIGSIGLVIRNMWYDPLLELEFINSYANGLHILGAAHTNAIFRYLAETGMDKYGCKMAQEWILFGDPSLAIG